jgi:putative ABC transport system permease protein
MNWLYNVRLRLHRLVHNQQFERDLQDELQLHVELQVQELVRRGIPHEQARKEALAMFGGVAQVREDCRQVRGIAWLESVCRDLSYAVRSLSGSPVFTIAVVLTLALGIAAATTVFSVVNGVLLAPLPYENADGLAVLNSVNLERGEVRDYVSIPDFLDWRANVDSVEAMAVYHWAHLDLRGDGGSERIQGLAVSADFFQALRIATTLGRTFSAEEAESVQDVIIISGDLWRRRFAADPEIVGRTIDVNTWQHYPDVGAVPFRVVGVVDSDTRFLPIEAGVDHRPLGVDDSVDFWIPARYSTDRDHREWRGSFRGVVRLREHHSLPQVEQEFNSVCSRLANEYPDTNRGWTVQLVPVSETVVGSVRLTLCLLLAASGILLLLALVNVCGLLLVRGISRRQELAIRSALGANRFRLIRHVLTEGLLLALMAGGLGSLTAAAGTRLLKSLAPAELPRVDRIAVDGRVLLLAIAASLLSGLLMAIVPACLATNTDPNSTLKPASRTSTRSRAGNRVLNALASTSVAISLALLIASGLLHQSLFRVLNVNAGFNRHNLLTMSLSLPDAMYEWQRNTDFCHEVLDAVRVLPGVTHAAAIRGVPTRETRFETRVLIDGSPEPPIDQLPLISIRVISRGYFETMGIPLLAGRTFEPPDEVGEIGYAHTIIINRRMAEQFWPGGSAVGKRVRIAGDLPFSEVIGVVDDVRYDSLDREAVPEMYYPDALFPQTTMNLIVRSPLDPRDLTTAVRESVLGIEPDTIITDVQTMEQVLRSSVARRRFAAVILTVFSITAFVLAVVGVFGVMAFSVSQRRQELGIRLALGAQPAQVLRSVFIHSFVLVGTGIVAGLALAWAGSRLLSAFLYGIEPTDPATYVTACLLLLAASTTACYLPARHAATTEPMSVLRNE